MKSTVQLPVVKITGNAVRSGPDLLAIEEPLEIRLAYGGRVQNLAVTMRTPGHDADLALGFLFTEGIITGAADAKTVEHVFLACSENRQNTILVTLKEGIIPNLRQAERNFYTTSSCGVCGKASIDAIRTVSARAVSNPVSGARDTCSGARDTCSDSRDTSSDSRGGEGIDPDLIISLPDRLSGQQEVFVETGGLHAAALFDRQGELLLVREDVGRHNALDKLAGAALKGATLKGEADTLSLQALSRSFEALSGSILLLSGRASFELVQKAAMAGIPVIAAVGAPSSLAVSLAEEFGITLIGFLRNNRFNIYSGMHRINMPAQENATHLKL